MSLSIKRKDYIYRFLQTFFKQSLTAFIYFFAAYKLSPDVYGQAVYFISIAALVLVFCDFGVSSSVIKFIAENQEKGDGFIDTILTKTTKTMTIISVAIILLAIGIKELINIGDENISNAIYLLIPHVILTPITSVIDGYLVGKKRFKTLFQINLIYWIIAIGIIYYLVTYKALTGVLLSISIKSILLFILYLVFIGKHFKITESNLSIKPIFKYSIVVGISTLSYFLYTRVDVFILESFSFIKEIGYYEIVNRIFGIIVIPFVIYAQVKAPNVASLYKQEQNLKPILKNYIKTMGAMFFIGIVTAAIIYFALPPLIKIFLPEYHNDEMILILTIMVGVLPLKFSGVVSTTGFITPSGNAKIVMYTTLIFGVLNIICDYIFISRYGFVGVFWATLLVHNINILIQLLIFTKRLKTRV